MSGLIRIAVVADGDPNSAQTNSGVSRGILQALGQRDDIEICAAIDSTPSRFESLALAVLTFRPKLSTWRNQKRKGYLATFLRSSRRDRAISAVAIPPDVVLHVRNTYLPSAVPYVVFIDGTASLSQKFWPDWRLTPRAYRRRVAQEKAFFDDALLVATAGTPAADEVVEFYQQSSARVSAIGGGTNMSARGRSSREGASADEIVRFLFVGKDFERKGGPELLDAFVALQADGLNCVLTVVGPDAPKAVPLNVEWLGFVSDRDRLSQIYQRADVFCLPSRYEPYGLVVQEALANGLACIVSDRGALADIVGDAGLVVEGENADSIASAMRALARDPELRDLLSSRASARLADATWDRVASRLVDAIKSRTSGAGTDSR